MNTNAIHEIQTDNVPQITSLPSLGAIKRALKTELFRRSYGNANYRPQQHWHYSCSV